ncbi:MAG: TonB-dependent receptor, partial [Ignavibacteriae bacterium]
MSYLVLIITTLCFLPSMNLWASHTGDERGVAVIPSEARNGEEPDTVHKSDVVVTASRLEQTRAEAPILVTVTDSKVLTAVQAVSLSEGLSFQPGLRLETNCQNCGFTQVRLNGLQGPYTQILIDSRPIFSALNGVYGLDQIPAAMIDRIEVTRGGGSAMFGAGAIAGTINILTKEPDHNGFEVGGTMRVVGDTTLDLNATASASWVSPSMLTGVTAFGVVRDRGFYDHNGDNYSELVKLNGASGGIHAHHYITDDDRLSAQAHWIREFRRGGEMTDAKPETTTITEQLDHAIVGGTLTYERSMQNDAARLSAYASAQHTQRASYYGGNGGDTAMTETAAKFYGNTDDLVLVGGVQYSETFATSFHKDLVFVGGAELQYNDVTDEMPGYERWIHQQTTNIGPYAQLQ